MFLNQLKAWSSHSLLNNWGDNTFTLVASSSTVYDTINTILICNKMRETKLAGKVSALIEVMDENTFGSTFYGGPLSE